MGARQLQPASNDTPSSLPQQDAAHMLNSPLVPAITLTTPTSIDNSPEAPPRDDSRQPLARLSSNQKSVRFDPVATRYAFDVDEVKSGGKEAQQAVTTKKLGRPSKVEKKRQSLNNPTKGKVNKNFGGKANLENRNCPSSPRSSNSNPTATSTKAPLENLDPPDKRFTKIQFTFKNDGSWDNFKR
jgi:hypothetical protein